MAKKSASKKPNKDLLSFWEDRAKQVYKETFHFMREGFHGLEMIAEKTVEVTRIKLSNQQALQRVRTLFTELGQRVYDTVVHQKRGFRLPSEFFPFVDQIKKFQSTIEENIDRLKHITTVGLSPKATTKRTSKSKKSRNI